MPLITSICVNLVVGVRKKFVDFLIRSLNLNLRNKSKDYDESTHHQRLLLHLLDLDLCRLGGIDELVHNEVLLG